MVGRGGMLRRAFFDHFKDFGPLLGVRWEITKRFRIDG